MRYLDPHNDAAPLPGYKLIDTEVAFLSDALAEDVIVRGGELGDWAIAFWKARGKSYREIGSPLKKLRQFNPNLTPQEAAELISAAPNGADRILSAARLDQILDILFPSDVWNSVPCVQHAAHWLVWLEKQRIQPFVEPLLKLQAKLWQDAVPESEQFLYTPTKSQQAKHLLIQWIEGDLQSNKWKALPPFPIPVPGHLLLEMRNAWEKCVIETGGLFYQEAFKKPLSVHIKQLIARDTANYFKLHSTQLKGSIVNELVPYLSMEEVSLLRNIVPPEIPGSLPADEMEVVTWFLDSYLPYRLWAVDKNDDEIRTRCNQSGRGFAKWYLKYYPKALAAGADVISFKRSGSIMQNRFDGVTLMIILDGIGIWDGWDLIQLLNNYQKRLTLTKSDWCFAALPSVTEICKPAMRQGVSPRNVKTNVYALAADSVRLFEHEDGAEVVKNASGKEFYIWSIIQTDQAYHKPGDVATIQHNVRTLLEGLAKRIASAVNAVPNEHRLKIIITTDHGRLLGGSKRVLPLAKGLTAHQRAAWGALMDNTEPKADFELEHNDRVARLHHERFGLSQSAYVAIDEDSFVTNDGSGGVDLFAHGGAFPEEVIIPWLEYHRDVETPVVYGEIVGSGVEGREGTLKLRLVNSSLLELKLETLNLKFGSTSLDYTLNRALAAKDTLTATQSLASWPSAEQSRTLKASCTVRSPSGELITLQLTVNLASESLQTRHDGLDDLL